MTTEMKVEPTTIPDVKVIRPQVFGDLRGFFMEAWNAEKFLAAGLDQNFVQDNHSRSARGTLRGLHYQLEQTQGKLVYVVTGSIFDVAVDLRRGSDSFGQWVGVTLSEENHKVLWVPPGFAHGFLVQSDYADVIYKCTDFYAPQHERTVSWNDPALNIDWPVPDDMELLLSTKDQEGVPFSAAEYFP